MSSVGYLAPRVDVRDQELEQRHEVVEVLARPVRRLDRRVRPAPELVAIVVVDPEQLGDHEHRERRRDRVDEVDLLTGLHLGEHRAGDRAHPIFEGGDRARCEPARHESAPRRVLRRVHVQDRALDVTTGAQRIVQQHAAPRTEPLGITTHRAHVVVARDGPRVRRVHAHRLVAAQARELVVVVGFGERADDFGIERHRHMNDVSCVEPFVGPRTRHRRLEVAPAPPTTDRIVDAQHRVADLMDATRGRRVRAVGEVFTVDVQLSAPFAVVVPVEPEVQAATEMESGVAHRFDGDRAGGAVGHREVQRAAEHAPVDRVEPELGPQRGEAFDLPVGVLDAAFDHRLLVAERAHQPMLVVDRVDGAVGSFEHHRAPREAERDTVEHGRVRTFEVGRGKTDVLAHAPRMVPGREPGLRRDRACARRRPRPTPTPTPSGDSAAPRRSRR